MCKYCKDYSLLSLPVRTNCNVLQECFTSLIADMGNGGKELVIHHNGKALGIPLNYCPVCGEKITGNETYIENYSEEDEYEKFL